MSEMSSSVSMAEGREGGGAMENKSLVNPSDLVNHVAKTHRGGGRRQAEYEIFKQMTLDNIARL